MSLEMNKNLARRFREELYNTGNLSVADEICASDYLQHVLDPLTPDFGRGPEAAKRTVAMYRGGFPDADCRIEEIIAQGDKVVARWTARGTQTGPLGPLGATGRRVEVTGMDILRISDGKIVESWCNWDTMGMLQQLGVAKLAGGASI
jgi:predicted SnoaL-like aldol condensation-catalyzing enzyme